MVVSPPKTTLIPSSPIRIGGVLRNRRDENVSSWDAHGMACKISTQTPNSQQFTATRPKIRGQTDHLKRRKRPMQRLMSTRAKHQRNNPILVSGLDQSVREF